MKRALFRAGVLLLLALPGCRLPKETAAEVNGRPVATADLEAEYRKFIAQFGQVPPTMEPTLPKVRRGILERLVNRELMLQEADRRGLRPTAQEVERALARGREGMQEKELDATLAEAGLDREGWYRTVERDLVLEKLQREITAKVAVSDPEVTDWRARHSDPRGQPEEVRASQILVRTEEEALKARRRILAGASFGQVAREVSLSPDADRGGDLGYFTRGLMPPEFDETVFALPPGQVSPVVETAYGHHLFLVTDRRAARTRSEAELREEVRGTLLAKKREKAFDSWLSGVRKAAKIRYNSKVVPE